MIYFVLLAEIVEDGRVLERIIVIISIDFMIFLVISKPVKLLFLLPAP